MTVQEESTTGDVDLERGIRQKSVTLPSSAVASPQISSQSSFSTSEQRNIWKRGLGIRVPKEIDTWDSEQKKYWKYRNIYHIPVPQGIEQWEDEDKKRWELINIGGLSESEADRQIKRTKARFTTRKQKDRDSRAPLRKDSFFIISLICFGFQITIALVCIGFCMFQIIDSGQIQAGIVFLLLALIPLFGATGGIFSSLMQSESLVLCTAIYNVASAVGIIVATINVYSFKVHQSYTLSAFIPLAGTVAFIQIASFGIVLIIYFKLSAATSAVANHPRYISNAQVRRSGARSYQKRMKLKAREKAERELQVKTEDVTRKYKKYLEKKNQIASKSDNETIKPEESSKTNMIVEQQMINPVGPRKINYETHQDNSDSQRHSALPVAHGEVKQQRETASGISETFKS